MAFVSDHYELTVQLVDAGGDVTTRSYRFRDSDTAGDISALITQQNALLTALQAVTLATIKRYSLARVGVNDAFGLPTSGQVEEAALITAQIDGDVLDSATISIPAPVDGIFQAAPGYLGYNDVDMTDTALGTFLGNFVGSSSAFLVSDGEAINLAVSSGKRVHRRSTRG